MVGYVGIGCQSDGEHQFIDIQPIIAISRIRPTA